MLAGSVTSSRVSETPSTTGAQRVLVALARARAAADDDDLVERRLLIVLELGPIAVVAPRAKRRAEADARRRIGVIAKAAEVDDGRLLARRQQPRGRGSAELFGGFAGATPFAGADDQQAADARRCRR